MCDHISVDPGGAWPGLGTGSYSDGNDPGVFGVGGLVYDICDKIASLPGLGGGRSDPGNDPVDAMCDNNSVKSGLGALSMFGISKPINPGPSGVCRVRACPISNIISDKSGLGGNALSSQGELGNGNSPSSSEPDHFCDAASGPCRTTTGAASAKLMMESIRRVRVNILCCRICGTRDVDYMTLSVEYSIRRKETNRVQNKQRRL